MGNQDAPKAPAGWYPIEEGKPGERYWDGNAWTGDTKGLPPKDSPKNEQKNATSKKGWLISAALLLIFILFIVFVVPLTVAKPFITSDKEACSAISNAIGKVNAENYGSVAGITVENNKIDGISIQAMAGSGSGVYEGTENGAKDEQLVSSLTELGNVVNFGTDLVNSQDGSSEPGHEPGYTLFVANQNLQKVASRCAELGFTLENAAFNFEVPEVVPATESSQVAAPSNPGVPEGFTDAGNGMSFKFIDGTCSYFKCSYVQIYSDSSCSNVYVEANTVDDSGIIYGMTNDMIGAMNPGDSAVAELNVLEDGATGVKLTKIQCY